MTIATKWQTICKFFIKKCKRTMKKDSLTGSPHHDFPGDTILINYSELNQGDNTSLFYCLALTTSSCSISIYDKGSYRAQMCTRNSTNSKQKGRKQPL